MKILIAALILLSGAVFLLGILWLSTYYPLSISTILILVILWGLGNEALK